MTPRPVSRRRTDHEVSGRGVGAHLPVGPRSHHRAGPGCGRLSPSSGPDPGHPGHSRAPSSSSDPRCCRGEWPDSLPAPHLSVGLAAQVAMDEALLAVAMTPRRFPLPGDYARVAAELADADDAVQRKGLDRGPPLLPPHPPAPLRPDVSRSRGWAMGLDYDRLSWDSGFEPHEGEPGRDRWMAFEPNRTASAVVLRHAGGPRPWVIAVHGFCMGFPFMDFQGLQIVPDPRRAGHERGHAGRCPCTAPAGSPWSAESRSSPSS